MLDGKRVVWGEKGGQGEGHLPPDPLSGDFLLLTQPRGQMPAGKLWLPSCSEQTLCSRENPRAQSLDVGQEGRGGSGRSL